VNDEFGKGTVIPLDGSLPADVEFFSTGQSSGKSTQCLFPVVCCTLPSLPSLLDASELPLVAISLPLVTPFGVRACVSLHSRCVLLPLTRLLTPPPVQCHTGAWPCAYCPALCLLSGPVLIVWPCAYCLALCLLSGPVLIVWPCAYCLALCLLPAPLSGPVLIVWPCAYCLGPVLIVWPCAYCLALCLLSGPVLIVWPCAYCPALCLLSGPVLIVWPCAYCLALCLLSGPVLIVWPCAYCLALCLLSGPVLIVRPCAYCPALCLLSGPVLIVWPCAYCPALCLLSGPLHRCLAGGLGSLLRAVVSAWVCAGILPLDLELQGGWPVGRMIEVYGPEQRRASLALYAIAEMQRQKKAVVLIDAEHAMDMNYAKRLGVVTEGPKRLMPGAAELRQAINVADSFIRSGVTRSSSSTPCPPSPPSRSSGLAGRSPGLPRAPHVPRPAPPRPCRSQGQMHSHLHQPDPEQDRGDGNPETTSGGLALRSHASVRCEMKIVERKRVGGGPGVSRARQDGQEARSPVPTSEAEFDMLHGYGMQPEAAVLDAAVKVSRGQRASGAAAADGQVASGEGQDRTRTCGENPEVLARALEMAVRGAIKREPPVG